MPFRRANEAVAYLTYVIDEYEKLPSVVVFHHWHLAAWHDEEDVGNASALFERFRADTVHHRGYMSLRSIWEPGCPAEMTSLQPQSNYVDVEA